MNAEKSKRLLVSIRKRQYVIWSNLASYRVTVQWAALAVTAITFLSFMPQLRFWLARGSDWQGSYVALQPDEVVYSAYVNAIIDGRPRRNDPAAGQDDHPQAPLPESLFSIQFIPSFIIAWLARVCGATASSAFIALIGIAGLLASLSLFWLLSSLTGDRNFAAVGMLVALCFGALAGGQGLIGSFLKRDVEFLGLPFLRRYEPAVPFPLFFVFCTLIWQALTTQFKRAALVKALLAGAILGVLIFSYFYLWTAAAAWVVCVACLWLFLRPLDRRRSIRLFIIASLPVILALGFYFYLLSHLPVAVDKAQVLTFTHLPDLLRAPEIIGAFSLVALMVGVWQGKVSVSTPPVIFAVSFAVLPFLVFNQQVITGRSIQPFHYEVLIANYVVLLGLVMVLRLLQPAIPHRTLVLIGFLCFLWAAVEINLPFQAHYSLHVRTDEMVPVLLRLKEEAKHDGTWEGLRTSGRTSGLVFSPQYGISELLPTWAPQGSLLAPGSTSFQSLSEAERKERLYTHFYYCGKNKEYLRELLNERTDVFLAWRAKSTIFGTERVSQVAGWDFQPIRQDEIEKEVSAYEAFADSFSHEQALKRPLTYAVTFADSMTDFTHIDRWYERDAGERVGDYTLYRLRLR
jgi:hypothetical protein